MSLRGILNAVKASLPGGIVWVFTDATAKEAYLLPQVLAEARRKKVVVLFGLTGSCSPVDKLYITLAEETGGQIFFGDRSSIGEIFAPTEDIIRGNYVTVSRSMINLNGTAVVSVPVDDTLDNVAFSTSVYDGVIDNVTIMRPDGTIVVDSDPNVTISKLGSDNQIIAVRDPIAGIWVLEVSGLGPATIIAQGNSVINIDYFQFVTSVAGRYEQMYVDIPGGNPIADGKNATALTRLEGPVASYTFEMADINGTVVDKAQELLNDAEAMNDEIVLTMNPIKPFSVVARGITSAGFAFQRLALPVYAPQSIKVSFDEVSRPVAIPEGLNTTVMFKVENYGTDTVVVDVSITADNTTYLRGYEPTQAEIPHNSSQTIYVLIAAPLGCIEGSLRLTAIATDDKLLGNSHTVYVTDICKSLPSSSASPTKEPTIKPTKQSSTKPTKKPTVKPTLQSKSTKNPTVKPTKQSSTKHTKKPTVKPTELPSTKSTEKPTDKPTKKSSKKSTEKPTVKPTKQSSKKSTREANS
jgi:hypothetical protein